MEFVNYDPKDISLSILGQKIEGFAPGTFVKVSRVTETYSDTAGALGDVQRTRSRDQRGTIEITLLDGHPSNTLLNNKATADENTGSGVGPSLVKHVSGRGLASGKNCWIVKKPDMEFGGGESKTRTWTIRVAQMQHDPAGYGAAPGTV